jgi:signal peptidase I
MARTDEREDPIGDGWWMSEEPSAEGSAFDPLVDLWPAAEMPPQRAVFDDEIFAYAPVHEEDQAWGWTYDPKAAVSPYPDRYQPVYRERLTELQQRLRAETITVPRPERRWAVTIRELAETLLLAALIFLAVRASFQNFRVEGASMQPSLENGEYLIVNKLSYAELDLGAFDWLPFFNVGNSRQELWGDPDRGDVIVFKAPTSTNRDFIKRIIGLPGDKIEIDSGVVTVNGQELSEPYIQGTTSCGEACVYEVPEAGTLEAHAECGSNECYFVMGDNRQNSSDSRQGWMVPRENIIGKALVTYWHDGGPSIGLAPNHSTGAAEEAD